MRGSFDAMRRSLAIIVIGGCLALPALAEEASRTATMAKHGLPQVSQPEELGFSSERLDRLSKVFKAGVDSGEIPGAVIEIARDGKIAYVEAFGFQDPTKKTPMATDAIFRIASMSKPITSVAAMMLAEEGKIDLAAPVSDYLPEFKEMKVAVEQTDSQTGKVDVSLQPTRRPITVQDLLRHTSGLTYGSRTSIAAIAKAYAEANVFDWNQTLAEMVTKLSKLPLAYQPGTTFEYSMSVAVLGRVIEVASGMPLDQFVAERITGPLGMSATGYGVNEADHGKIAQPSIDPATDKLAIALVTPVEKPHWIAGGEGMWSSADDYLRFCQMLLNGGELDGVRVLSPKTVEFMTTDHLPPDVAYGGGTKNFGTVLPSPEMGQGFGLGFAVRKDAGRNPLPGSVGEFYWLGVDGTAFWVDPSEKLIALMLTQTPVPRFRHYLDEMRYLTYQAIIEAPERQVLSGTSVKPH